ncbi:serine hydrolase [Nocardia sp. NPDC004654]|uniref:serine hydrolase n=1 Tax=Nocardia sp. NPDC004654 TaxID=3154776 RepID=UPI0033A657CA
MAQIQGWCDDRFGAVAEALAASLDSDDGGAAAAVFVDGAPVVDIWGGYADAAGTVAWERDTIVTVWSTTSGPMCWPVIGSAASVRGRHPTSHRSPIPCHTRGLRATRIRPIASGYRNRPRSRRRPIDIVGGRRWRLRLSSQEDL